MYTFSGIYSSPGVIQMIFRKNKKSMNRKLRAPSSDGDSIEKKTIDFSDKLGQDLFALIANKGNFGRNNLYWAQKKKQDYLSFRSLVNEATLVALSKYTISEINSEGVYCWVREDEKWLYLYGKNKENGEEGSPFAEWIRGGARCGLFGPEAMFTFVSSPLLPFISIKLKEDWKILDPTNPRHQHLICENAQSINPYGTTRNVSERFFRKHHFGAIISLTNYVNMRIIIPDAVKEMKFFLYNVRSEIARNQFLDSGHYKIE